MCDRVLIEELKHAIFTKNIVLFGFLQRAKSHVFSANTIVLRVKFDTKLITLYTKDGTPAFICNYKRTIGQSGHTYIQCGTSYRTLSDFLKKANIPQYRSTDNG